MGKLDGKVVLITGAAKGQGRSHALRLAQDGADIIAVDLCEPYETVNYPMPTGEDLAQTAKEVEALNRRVVTAKADVRERDQLESAIDAGLAEFGHLDVVVANAGIFPAKETTLIRGFVDATDVDLIGVMNTVAASLPHLQSGASIIVTGSVAGLMNAITEGISSGSTGYMFAKRMIFQYVETTALLLAPHMIRLNGIHPTNCDTDMIHNIDMYRMFRSDLENPTREDAMVTFPSFNAMPIPYIDPEDVSHLVAFLASDESRYITGTNIRIDAGAMLKKPPS